MTGDIAKMSYATSPPLRRRRAALAAISAIALSAACGAANAGTAARVWVSGKGTDAAGCGAPTAPCRSLQYAHDNVVVAGGEIDVLDPAGYGAVTITKAVSIVNDGVGTAGLQATSGSAVTINAGPGDAIYLRGLNIDGVQFTGANGVVLNSAGGLTIADCVIRHFLNAGVSLNLGSGLARVSISNTIVDNDTTGIADAPTVGAGTVSLIMDHVTAEHDAVGVNITLSSASQAATAVITHLIARNIQSQGVIVQSAPGVPNAIVSLDSSWINNTFTADLLAANAATVYLSNSVIAQSAGDGVDNQTSSPGAVFTYGDNRIVDSATNLAGVALVSQPLQ
jgi:hypothetical protein